ncbi:hypothetical protein QJS04_geneDACA003387 [Acorus gramineus]|uniref:KIB1-4 beta-propeller domain-containing protein n=1 Tax=Acorus gramineus TaxID=55184 RepID=A0AAV9BLM2_ACOGR|nr:hypothetical protein QJS04_geneDACA003387 [Acorus gramineus]
MTTRAWSHLPVAFLKHLLPLVDVPSYIRFSSVCHRWHISKKLSQTLPSPHLPFLLLPRHHSTSNPSLSFFNLSDSLTYHIPSPIISNSLFVSSLSLGYLLLDLRFNGRPVPDSKFLLNPLSDDHLPLPESILVPKSVTAAAILSDNDGGGGGFWVCLAFGNSVFFWNPKSKTAFRTDFDSVGEIVDVAADGGVLYFVTGDMDLVAYDPLRGCRTMLVVVPPEEEVEEGVPMPCFECDHFLVVAPSEDGEVKVLLAVVHYSCLGKRRKAVGVERVEVFSAVQGGGGRGGGWVRVEEEVAETEVGGLVLFLSYGGSSFCVKAADVGRRDRGGGVACLVPAPEKMDSMASYQKLDLMCVEIDLASGDVTYKGR